MAQQVAPRQSIRVEISNRNRLFHLLNFVNKGGGKIRARHSEIAVETCRPIAHNVPYVKKLFDKALKICSGSKLIYYCYTSKFLWRIFKKLLFNFDIFNNFYKNRRFIEYFFIYFFANKARQPGRGCLAKIPRNRYRLANPC